MKNSIVALCLVLGAIPAAAQTQLDWAGHLEDGGVPVDGTVSLSLVVRTTDDNAVVDTIDEAALVVVDGDFVVSVLVPTTAASLSIVINGADFGTVPLAAAWPSAAIADAAGDVDVAASAASIDGITDVFSDAELAAGAVPVALANISGFPAPFLDGDQGIDFSVSTNFTFTNGALAIAAGSISANQRSGNLLQGDIAVGGVATADLKDNEIRAGDFTAAVLPLTALAAATLDSTHFSTAGNTSQLFVVTEGRCREEVGTITNDNDCTFDTTVACQFAPGVTGSRDCRDVCIDSPVGLFSDCPNAVAGHLVFK